MRLETERMIDGFLQRRSCCVRAIFLGINLILERDDNAGHAYGRSINSLQQLSMPYGILQKLIYFETVSRTILLLRVYHHTVFAEISKNFDQLQI